MMEIDEKNGSIQVVENLSFKIHVIPVIELMKEVLENEIGYLDDENEIIEIKKFLNTTEFTPEQVVSCLQEIINYLDYANYFSAHSIFEETVILGDVHNWIENEFNISCNF